MVKIYRSDKAGQKIIETYDLLLARWDCEIIEHDVQTKYGATHVIETGTKDGEPIILFHGVGDDSALMWVYNAKALGEHYHIYAIDTIGGPGKSRPNENYNKDFSDVLWIDEILSNFGIQKAYFIGVSHGGYQVQLYSLKRPEKVIKAISIAWTVPVKRKRKASDLFKTFLPEALCPTDKNVIKLLKKLSGKNYAVFTEDELILLHYKYLIRGMNNMAMKYHNVHDFTLNEVDQIRDKVVYLAGEDDPFQIIGGKAALLDNKMNVVFYEGAGHGLNHELADEINSKILALFFKANAHMSLN